MRLSLLCGALLLLATSDLLSAASTTAACISTLHYSADIS